MSFYSQYYDRTTSAGGSTKLLFFETRSYSFTPNAQKLRNIIAPQDNAEKQRVNI